MQILAIGPIWFYICIWIDCLIEMQNYRMRSIAFIVSSCRVTLDNELIETDLLNIFTAQGSHLYIFIFSKMGKLVRDSSDVKVFYHTGRHSLSWYYIHV